MTDTFRDRAPIPERCVIVVDDELAAGQAANAAAVIALTVGQRHPGLVGAPLIDASNHEHPGLIPIGIAVLAAGQDDLVEIRHKGIIANCDIVDFPIQGQQTKDYAAFRDAVAQVETRDLRYAGIALVGDSKPIRKTVAKCRLFK